MEKVALGKYVESELTGPMMQPASSRRSVRVQRDQNRQAQQAGVDALHRQDQAGLQRRFARHVALKKASAQLDGGDFCIGATENPANAGEGFYIPPERIEQAKQVVADGREPTASNSFCPVDFVMADESVKETLDADDQQFDIGPASVALFDEKVGEFIAAAESRDDKPVLFHNGVFGMFEDPRFEQGTRAFVQQLKRMTEAGIRVFVGGGEGGKSLEKYGEENWVEHNFTAGGTVLSAIGKEPIPYMVALKQHGS